jgi:hypothetical protein
MPNVITMHRQFPVQDTDETVHILGLYSRVNHPYVFLAVDYKVMSAGLHFALMLSSQLLLMA